MKNYLNIMLLLCVFGAIQAAEESSKKSNRLGTEYVYKKVEGRELKLYVVTPTGWAATDRRPAIVWFHGGAWVKGGPTAFDAQSQYLAERGMVCIQVQYRLMEKGSKEGPVVCVYDALSSMRWVRSHAGELGIDPDRIAAGGGSAGGHLAGVCGLIQGVDDPQDDLKISAKPQALVLFNPVIDTGPKTTWGRNVFGERAEALSPTHHVTAGAPPTIVFLGTADNLIPVSVVENFKKSMEKAGVRCQAVYYEGQGHGFVNLNQGGPKYIYESLLEIDKFFASLGWLTGPPTLKKPDEKELKSSGSVSPQENLN